MIYPTAIGWESTDSVGRKKRQHDAWQTIQRGHAVANGLPVITVNRVGHEPTFSGVTMEYSFGDKVSCIKFQGELLHLLSDKVEENSS